jgi:hypothetical protein
MDMGSLGGFVQYLSDNAQARFWSLGPEVRVSRARACLSCGYVELYLDPEVLRSKLE